MNNLMNKWADRQLGDYHRATKEEREEAQRDMEVRLRAELRERRAAADRERREAAEREQRVKAERVRAEAVTTEKHIRKAMMYHGSIAALRRASPAPREAAPRSAVFSPWADGRGKKQQGL
jgi:cell wall assembly regulator SMI1